MSANVVAPDRKITRGDIESKLRELQGGVSQRAETAKTAGLAIAVGIVVVTLASAYLMGRRRGNRRRMVLEIRRL